MTKKEEVKKYASDRHASPRWAVQLPARFKGPFAELAKSRGVSVTELLSAALDGYLKAKK